jgi:hypothetical protein
MEEQPYDLVDLLCALGIFASFVVFGVCMWIIKREMNKKKNNQKK